MAGKRAVFPEPSMPDDPNDAASPAASLRRISAFLGCIVAAIVLVFCYFASALCITIVLSAFLSIVVDPLVLQLERLRFGRPLAAGVVVLCGMLLAGLLTYVVFQRAASFAGDFPKYADKIKQAINPLTSKIERLQNNAQSLNTAIPTPKVPEVRIKPESPNWSSFVIRGVGSISGALVICGVVPFLVFLLLLRKTQMHTRFFGILENRIDFPKFIISLNQMVRGFVVGNLVVGAIMAGATSLVFLILGLKNPVTLGIVTGFLNLTPFLGGLLGGALALAAALLQFDTVGPFLVIALTIAILHLVAANLLVPQFIGSRVRLGSVAVLIGMLFWSWLWGLAGLLLAVPLTALVKLIADTNPSLVHVSNFLAETPRPAPRWVQLGAGAVRKVRPYYLRARAPRTAGKSGPLP